MPSYPTTPDGRYFVAKNRLWRSTDPGLPEAERKAAVLELMSARRAIKGAQGEALKTARARVDAAKRRLGERGEVWWTDGAPDEGGRHPRNSAYAEWWASLPAADREAGG
ncbi:hypothetical protein RM543_08140 [Roseicyclus sp. F158]|uniref:Uncharacterized protein n=1 Tax=Tropicimonas omnivorans TaxID=3075590 RepID=A0ABU3DG38_9RHOB|nr:hypothetical protein [Roseicyclus sp. F158]MDT0682652.1 hypothetical protein [Roseicyclus sp. F158]